MASVSPNLLADMENWDKDKRFMAAIDLTTEINNTQGLELHLQQRICYAFLKQLDDQSVEVQGNAVKCLAKIVCKLDMQVAEVVAKLSLLVLDGKSEVFDIHATCLKGLLSELPKSASTMVCQNVFPKMLQGITSPSNEVKEECTDVLCDLLKRFGDNKVWWSEQEKTTQSLLTLLGQQYKSSLRKKASVCLGVLSSVVSDRQLDHICKVLLQEVRQARSKQEKQTYIQCISVVSKNVGGRMGPHLENIPGLLLQICRSATADVGMSENTEDYEVVELCLNAFESFVVRCPREISKHLDDLSDLLLTLLSFDPNLYQSGEADDQDNEMVDSDEDYGDSDDDDTAWKIRRAALKCLASFVKTAEEERLLLCYQRFSQPLIQRFSTEREENVKLDSFVTFQAMVHSALTKGGLKESASRLISAMPQAILALQKQLRGKSLKIRQGAITTIKIIAEAIPQQLEPCLISLENELTPCLKDVNNSIRLDAITILYQCSIQYQNAEIYQKLAPVFFPLLLEAVESGSHTIIGSALRTCGAYVNPLRPDNNAGNDSITVVLPLFQTIKRRLESPDIDHEVKERGLECMGMLLARIGDLPACLPYIQECMPPFLERMRNEVTRSTAIRALKTICDSSIHVPIESSIPKVVQFLCEYLHKNSRQLCLDSFVSLTRKYGRSMDPATHSSIVQSVAQYIAEDDLYLTDLSVQVLHNCFSVALATPDVLDSCIGEVIRILRSPLLQGGALESILQLLSLLAKTNSELACNLFTQLSDVTDVPRNPQGARQTIATLARCLARLALFTDSDGHARVAAFLSVLNGPIDKTNLHQVELSTLALGEMGKLMDLSNTKVCDALMAQLSSQYDDLSAAAALALGMCSLSSGAMGRMLKEVVDQIAVSNAKTQYLLLTSLREVVSFDSQFPDIAANLEPHVPNVLPILKQFASSSEECVRYIVAECLGSLLVIHQAIVLETVQPMMRSTLWQERMVAVSALRFAAKIPKCSPHTLEPLIPHFLQTLSDDEIAVRKSALQSVNAIILSTALQPLLQEHATLLLDRCAEDGTPRPNLVREVDLGPFKHKVDDGLPLRKFAYNVTTSLIAVYPDKFPLRGRFMEFVLQGFQDAEDIQALSCQLLSDLCSVKDHASVDESVVEKLGDLLEPFEKCITRATKQIQGKEQVQGDARANDTLRLYIRTLKSVEPIAEMARHKQFLEFLARMQKDPVFACLW